jgi:hypothetical protein
VGIGVARWLIASSVGASVNKLRVFSGCESSVSASSRGCESSVGAFSVGASLPWVPVFSGCQSSVSASL